MRQNRALHADTDVFAGQICTGLLALTADIFVAFLPNRIDAEAVPHLISATHGALARLWVTGTKAPAEIEEIVALSTGAPAR
ncbi:hypothetical protein P6008_17615 [Ectobacillus antri]|nr:hypothetical protein [Ectobacillus antri]MDG4658642.1 hypothetical protein [Ectobacillus antri]